ncbi:hypothetical protein [Microbacterium sp. NPDC079995]|uniref:hypothetical protein n=1 Tax=unclassified Microbacterium TaxID=2609290 RepID=UPI00344F3118
MFDAPAEELNESYVCPMPTWPVTPTSDKLRVDTRRFPVATSAPTPTWSEIWNGISVAPGRDPVTPTVTGPVGSAAYAGAAMPTNNAALSKPTETADINRLAEETHPGPDLSS